MDKYKTNPSKEWLPQERLHLIIEMLDTALKDNIVTSHDHLKPLLESILYISVMHKSLLNSNRKTLNVDEVNNG